MPTMLEKIVATKRNEIRAVQQETPARELLSAIKDAPPVRNFCSTLAGDGPIRLIAEIKKASPSAGIIREDFDPIEIATIYAAHGATCLSVLTDESYFHGCLSYLKAVRQAVKLPVLRKDFILDEYQLLEARVAGADAVLLIAECLPDCNLRKLHDRSLELDMAPLVEFYDGDNLSRVLDTGATLIGINNRNLRNFETDLEHTIRLRKEIPDHCIVVGESGIRTRDDVVRLQAAGVHAVLVGETLMKSPDIGTAVDQLLGS